MRLRGSRAIPERPFMLPGLTRFGGDRLEARGHYEAIDFVDRDFTGQQADEARFLDCRLQRCCVEGLSMRRAGILGSLLADVHGASVELADSTWRDARISGGRLGAMMMAAGTWTGVRVLGSRIGFLNLAGAKLEDVLFEDCEIGSLDARGAQLRSVAFVDCSMDELNIAEATLDKVDLSGLRLRSLVGIERLRGAIVGHQQLLDLAPLLAAQFGLEVRPEDPDQDAPIAAGNQAPQV